MKNKGEFHRFKMPWKTIAERARTFLGEKIKTALLELLLYLLNCYY